MIKRIFILILLFTGSLLNAQILDHDMMNLMDEIDRNKILRGENMIIEYSGSPYLSADFKKGTIELIDGKIFKDIPLRYNIFNDNFEIKNKEEEFGLEKSKKFHEFKMGELIFRYEKYQITKNKEGEGYLEVLTEGAYTLYCKHNVSFTQAKKAAAYKEAVPPTFKKLGTDYLMQHDTGNIIRVKTSGDILKKYPEVESLLKVYAPKGKIKLREKEDFIKLVEYINK